MRKIIKFYEGLDRELFIDGQTKLAKMNTALHISCGQTIPTPTTVMLMTKMLELDKTCKVLEIGTGSGYNAAFLAEFAKQVYTVEIHKELADKAKKRLKKLGYKNIVFKTGSGINGWEKHAPYDRIVVTASAKQAPLHLLEQLTPNGILIAPAFEENMRQDLTMYVKNNKEIETYRITGVRFVPIT